MMATQRTTPVHLASRPPLSRVLAVLLALGLLLSPAWAVVAAPAPTVVRVAFTPLQAWAPLFIGEAEGFFAREGIKVEWVTFAGGADTVAVLIQGQLDVGAGSASAGFFNAVAQGARVRIVADKGHVEPGFRAVALVARKDLKAGAVPTIADLKGRKVALNTLGAIAHYVLARSLARAGLGATDVEIVRMPFPAMVGALQTGAVDAAVLSEPFVTQALESGAGTMLMPAGDVVPDEPVAFLFYGPTLLDRSPDVGRRFMVAYLRALRQYTQGPTARNVRIVALQTKIEPELIRKGGWFPMYADGHVNINAIRRFQDWLYDQRFITVRMPVSALVDPTFLSAAAELLGGR
jgi:NitT/TauT family transport system substrate-binding protein